MQYENKILNFHIYLYFPSNIFKKFKNIKIKGLTYYILTCIISLVFTRNKSKHTIQYARVAQWWSTSLPRRGSRVRSPSRALLDNKRTSEWEVLFCHPGSAGHFSKPNCFTVWLRFLRALKCSSVVSEPRSTGPCGTRLA